MSRRQVEGVLSRVRAFIPHDAIYGVSNIFSKTSSSSSLVDETRFFPGSSFEALDEGGDGSDGHNNNREPTASLTLSESFPLHCWGFYNIKCASTRQEDDERKED